LEDALALFALPRIVGQYEGEWVTAAVGKFWPYLKYKTFFVSIPKILDPYTITMDEATPLIEKKIDTEKNKYINNFDHEWKKIEVLNGLYGAYIKFDGNNYKIPKGWKDASDLTKDECLEIIASGPKWSKAESRTAGPKFGAKKEAAPAKKAAAKKTAEKKTPAKTAAKKPAAKKVAPKKK
jgi:DNA topoisomerase-1